MAPSGFRKPWAESLNATTGSLRDCIDNAALNARFRTKHTAKGGVYALHDHRHRRRVERQYGHIGKAFFCEQKNQKTSSCLPATFK
jgi:hypothetical protein